MARTPRLLDVAWAVSAFAWLAFWIVLLASGDRHDDKALVIALFVFGSPSQLGFIWSGLRSRRRSRRRADVPPFLEPSDRPQAPGRPHR